MNNLNHPFDFLRRNRPSATLLPQQVHYVGGEFVTSLKQRQSVPSLLSVNCVKGEFEIFFVKYNQLKIWNCFEINLNILRIRRHDDRQRTKMSKRCEKKYCDQSVKGKIERRSEGRSERRRTRTYNALFLVAARFKGKRTLLDISIRGEHAASQKRENQRMRERERK